MKHDHIIVFLRTILSAVIAYLEYGIFFTAVAGCRWPTPPLMSTNNSPPLHVLIVADPQILDRHSYPERGPVLTYLSQLFVDLNMRKSWRAIVYKKPDAIFVLGDMLDNGRSAIEDKEYERYYRRYKNMFSSNSIPQFFLPGNHDVGLTLMTLPKFSPSAHTRFISHFGPLNSKVHLAGHTFLLIDAPGLVEEDAERTLTSRPLGKWQPKPNGTLEFIMNFSKEATPENIILLTHIPLARSQSADCGPLRERGTIRAGSGMGYQNTLGPEISTFLLDILRPAITVVYSGDDHDYCDYTHPSIHHNEPDSGIREVTVKSFSMAMGVRRPGFQLLSLAQEAAPSLRPSDKYADTLCRLPDQIGIYLSAYPCIVLLALLVIGWINSPWSQSCTHRHQRERKLELTRWLSIPSLRAHMEHIGTLSTTTSLDEVAASLPRPVAAGRRPSSLPWIHAQQSCLGASFELLYQSALWLLLSGLSRHPRPRRFWRRFVRDVCDVAIFPIGIFVIVAFWVSL